MTHPRNNRNATNYRIRVKGYLDPKWSDWFEQMAITTQGGDTILSGPVTDQAALHGLLIRIRDLNLTLLSIERIEPQREMYRMSYKLPSTREGK